MFRVRLPCVAAFAVIASILQPAFSARAQAPFNVLDSGAKGDCVTDNSAAINAAIASAADLKGTTHAGAVLFPKPSGGCYLIMHPVKLPGSGTDAYNIVISLQGEGRGVSVIKAGAAMDAVLKKDANWNTGDTILDLTFDANGLANHAIHVLNGSEIQFARIEGLNGIVDDLRLDDSGEWNGENFVSESYFANTRTFPPYNIYISSNSTDNEFTDNVVLNAKTANIEEAGGGSNHFSGNHAYGWPANLCPKYSFVTAYTSVWVGNQSDCSTEAAFLVNGWNSQVENNLIQGAANHAICISPEVGDAQILGNSMSFAKHSAPANAIVQGVVQSGQVSCSGAAVQTATWGTDANYGASNVVLNNWPISNENLWGTVFIGKLNKAQAIGIGTATPMATLDVNGYERLSTNSSAPAQCKAAIKGAIALNHVSRICVCDGSSWKLDSSGGACPW